MVPSVGAGEGGSHGRHSAATVEGADVCAHGQTEPGVVRWWLREDEQQQVFFPLLAVPREEFHGLICSDDRTEFHLISIALLLSSIPTPSTFWRK